jgi:hypothetical protein
MVRMSLAAALPCPRVQAVGCPLLKPMLDVEGGGKWITECFNAESLLCVAMAVSCRIQPPAVHA